WDAGEWYRFRGGCEGAGYASYPYPKTTEALLCLVGISRRYYLGDDVDGSIQLNKCSQSNKGVPADVSDPDPLAFADAPSPHPADVIRRVFSRCCCRRGPGF
nr:hypothetical protein [Tanacetum cinerariifolium]